ncbi:MAG: RluA family pseudouridine synthase [Chitinispirillia bacterium]|nr:RluA family pseudouridine synthase [Chitinispirillia bacterium]MCL2268661.1 RluA family pseudouridine synthase [Chitinispirillia bacterium]
MVFSSAVPTNVRAPVPIAEYLASRFTYHSPEKWAEITGEGRVCINGAVVTWQDCVNAGDTVSYDPGDFEEPPADLSYSIIYEDEWTLAVNKPGNLLVHRAGRSFRNNLVYQLRTVNNPPYPGCHPVHRLDRETSGVVLVAKDSEQGGIFGKLFVDGSITKIYKAVVAGCPDVTAPFVIEGAISADKGAAEGRCKFRVDDGGKPAVTVIEGARVFDNGLSLLTIRPVTGRTHQIRVHLAHIGFPIEGDSVYGFVDGDGIVSRRHALHCESLSFTHPHTGKYCEIKAELPADIAAMLNN